MSTDTRIALVRHLSACSVHSQDYNRVRLDRAPWDNVGETRPDLRPETAPSQRMTHQRPTPSRAHAAAKAEMFRRVLTEMHSEATQ